MEKIADQITSKAFIKKLKMNNGNLIPQFGLGTYQISSQKDVDQALYDAFQLGYRQIDTAVMYQNEKLIGNSIKKLQLPREELFITTKILPSDITYDKTQSSIIKSLKDLQTNYIDLALLHWPGAPSIKERQESWKSLEEFYEKGIIKNIGVSNFLERHIKSITDNQCKVKPQINQIEIHPLYIDNQTIDYCRKENILLQAYSPLAVFDKKLMKNQEIIQLSEKYKKTTAQIILRWGVQQDFIVIPRSRQKQHLEENIFINDFELTQEEMLKITSLDIKYKTDWDPIYVE